MFYLKVLQASVQGSIKRFSLSPVRRTTLGEKTPKGDEYHPATQRPCGNDITEMNDGLCT